MASEKNSRSRSWCFTWNNYEDEDVKSLFEWNKEQCSWWIAGMETGDNGTPHIQGAWYFKNQRYFSALKKKWPKVHLEVMRGTCAQSKEYCSKDGNFFEGGSLPSAGARTDLIELKESILNGKAVEEVLLEDPQLYHTYGRTLNAIEDVRLSALKRTEMTKGIWFWGPSGVGKSHQALKLAEGKTSYKVTKRDKGWWDNYKGQEVVIIEEMRGEIPYDELLEMVDKYEYSVPRRGRPPYPFTSKVVIITSPIPPQEVYRRRNERDGLDQLFRRFEIIHLKDVYSESVLTQRWSGNTRLTTESEVHVPLTSELKNKDTTCGLCGELFCECEIEI